MKWTILGFNQSELIDLKITLDETLILRYFVDFKDSGKMVKEYMKDDMYYWINYEKLKEQLPILDISKDRIYRKLKHLCKVGVLKHKTKRKGGVFSFYALGDKYYKLITDDSVKTTEPYGENNGTHTVKTTEPYGKNNGTKDSSIKDESIKEYICSSKEQLSEVYKLYQELGFGLPNKIIAEMIEDDVKKYSKEWFMKALKIAVKENKLKLSYVEGILQNWKRNGGMNNGKAGDKDGGRSMSKPKYNNKQNKSTAGEDRAEAYDLSDL